MISQETLDAVNKGVLTDEQLKEALKHYRDLEKLLKPHGQLYHLVWRDVISTLTVLENFHDLRNRD